MNPRPLVLSLFPGIDLFGRGFEAEGFCVVRGPDLMTGGDIRDFTPAESRFDGIIGGPPCQEFSRANRRRDPARGALMLAEFSRCVTTAKPTWWLMENVPTVPDLRIPGYTWQRTDFDALEIGAEQRRLRHFQFGVLLGGHSSGVPAGHTLTIERVSGRRGVTVPTVTGKTPLPFPRLCELQGLTGPLALEFFSAEGRRQAVANAVHFGVARAVAAAVRECVFTRARHTDDPLCACGCGRPVTGRERTAGIACRKRLQRQRAKYSIHPMSALGAGSQDAS